jgi:hypothetical protein
VVAVVVDHYKWCKLVVLVVVVSKLTVVLVVLEQSRFAGGAGLNGSIYGAGGGGAGAVGQQVLYLMLVMVV